MGVTVLYLVTGVIQILLVDVLKHRELLGGKALCLPTLANVCGMAACGTLVTKKEWCAGLRLLMSPSRFRRVLMLGVCVDLASGVLLSMGLVMTGSGIFAVLYSSVTAWTAVLSRVFLGKCLTKTQVSGIAVVCTGLVTNVFGSNDQLSGAALTPVLVGSALVLSGSFSHSAMFVVTEHAVENERISPMLWSALLGSIETFLLGAWILLLTFGHADNADVKGTALTGEFNMRGAVLGFMLLVCVDLVHAASFFTIVSGAGSVSASLLKGLQTVTLTTAAWVVFCPAEPSSCLTGIKCLSIVQVVFGSAIYFRSPPLTVPVDKSYV